MPQTSLPAACISTARITAARNGSSKKILCRIQTIILPFSLTRWYAGGRGRRLAKPGHRCLQTSDGGTQQSLAWLAGLGKFSRHDTHLLEENRFKDAADPLQPPQESPTTPRQHGCTQELSYFTPKMAELLPRSTRGHGALEEESAGEEQCSSKSGKYEGKQVCNSLNVVTTHPAPLHKITWNPVRAARWEAVAAGCSGQVMLTSALKQALLPCSSPGTPTARLPSCCPNSSIPHLALQAKIPISS